MPPASAEGRFRLTLPDGAATARLAEDVAAVLASGDLVALSGGLGSGKTSFARALLRSLAGDAALEVQSPTFPLRIDHALPRFPVAHADLYRLGSSDELTEIGLEEALVEGAALVEWPEKLPRDLAENRLDIAFAIDGQGRSAEISGAGSWPVRLARTRAIRSFLDASGWPGVARSPLAGDASYRAYEKVTRDAVAAILMNASARVEGPPIYGSRSYDEVAHRAKDVRAFVAIGNALRAAGVRAPEILAADLDAGLLLLEDLGAEGIVDPSGAPIIERYEAAIDLLAFMHARQCPAEAPLPDEETYRTPAYDGDALLIEISLFPDWFGGHGGEPAFVGRGLMSGGSSPLFEIPAVSI